MAKERDEPLTPAGRLFLQPETHQIIHCVLGYKQPPNIDAIRSAISSSLMINHPRFCSLLVVDRHGREYWRKTKVNIDNHIIVRNEPLSDDTSDKDDDEVVNDFLADLTVSTPLSTDKPLWEIHVLLAHKCAVLRVHHALGDGISLMSLLLTSCRKADDPEKMPTINSVGSSSSGSSRRSGRWGVGVLWTVVKMVWFTLVYVMEFGMRALWMSDKKTAVSGGGGVELWPRKLATARFRLDDMRTVKKAVLDATINDVLFGVISAGLSKYLEMQTPHDLQEGLQITGLAMVNLRPQPGLQELSDLMASKSGTRWGNKFGMLLLPVYYHKGGCDPLQYLKTAKTMIDRKKLSLEAYFSYKIGYTVMKLLGAKFASWLNYRIVCNTTFTISNVIGPREEITIAGNKVDYIRTTSTSLPHAITMHMMSYAGMADMQILVAKDIIPDPKVLAKCFEDALLDMKAAAEAAKKPQETQ